MNIGGINTYKQMQIDSQKSGLSSGLPRNIISEDISDDIKAEIDAVNIARERRDTKTIAIDLLNSGAALDAADAIVKAKEMSFQNVFNEAMTKML